MTSSTRPTEATDDPAQRRRALGAVILAAGKGTRMRSDLPKVLHPVAGEPMAWWVFAAARDVGAMPVTLVIGHGGELVRQAFDGRVRPGEVDFVAQEQQLGTGHAVMQARTQLKSLGSGDVLILCGDGPLIRVETLRQLLDAHRRSNAAATLATAVLADATGYGRVIRDDAGRFLRIREERDASPAEREVREVNPSYYCFRADALLDALDRLDNNNAKGEYYLTDVLEILRDMGRHVEVVDAVPPDDVHSINTPEQLAAVDAILSRRLGRGASGAVARDATDDTPSGRGRVTA